VCVINNQDVDAYIRHVHIKHDVEVYIVQSMFYQETTRWRAQRVCLFVNTHQYVCVYIMQVYVVNTQDVSACIAHGLDRQTIRRRTTLLVCDHQTIR
jgi:hypothetical protein